MLRGWSKMAGLGGGWWEGSPGEGDMSVHIVHAADSLCCTAKLTEFCKELYLH